MSYIGNTSTTQAFIPAIDYFNGDGSTVAFTLSRPVASVAQVQANISNVPQNPSSAFSVSGSTITFTSAPPSGTNNIYVYYTSPITQVIAPSQGTVTSSSFGTITDFTTTGNTVLGDASTDTLNVGNGGLVKDASGNVGIGSSQLNNSLLTVSKSVNGDVALGVLNTNSGANANARIDVGGSNYGNSELTMTAYSDTFAGTLFGITAAKLKAVFDNSGTAATNGLLIGTAGANPLYFCTSGAERMRIDSSGNLLVGTTSSLIGSTGGGSLTLGIGGVGSNNTGTLALNGSSAANYGATLFGYSNGSYSWAVGSYSNIIGGGSTSTFITIRNSGGGGVYLNGSSATSWTAVSDETRKIIIEPITNAADKVATLRAVIGRLKSDEETVRRPYLIAQDVQNVLPEAVSEAVDEEGPVLGLSYTEVIPLLVAAIKEQQAIITSLTDRITALEGAK